MIQSTSKRYYALDNPQNTFWIIRNPNDTMNASSGTVDDKKQRLRIMLQSNVTLEKILMRLHPEADKNLTNFRSQCEILHVRQNRPLQ